MSDILISHWRYTDRVRPEPQPTSSRWRALTYRQIHRQNPSLAEDTVGELTDTLLRWTSDLFSATGCTNEEVSISNLREGYGSQVDRIARSIAKLSQVIREDIMSTSFELIAVEHTEAFNPDLMDDAFKEYIASEGQILATTELGLKCKTRKDIEKFPGTGESAFDQRLLLRPKVILESAVRILDGADT